MGLEISDGVGMVVGKFLDFIDAPLGEINFSGTAGIHIAVRNAESFLCKIQLALVGSADNQNLGNLLFSLSFRASAHTASR